MHLALSALLLTLHCACGRKRWPRSRLLGSMAQMAMGQNPVPPVNIPIPTKVSKMGGAPTPKWDTIGFDNHGQIVSLSFSRGASGARQSLPGVVQGGALSKCLGAAFKCVAVADVKTARISRAAASLALESFAGKLALRISHSAAPSRYAWVLAASLTDRQRHL